MSHASTPYKIERRTKNKRVGASRIVFEPPRIIRSSGADVFAGIA
jgi:hypothetical protein